MTNSVNEFYTLERTVTEFEVTDQHLKLMRRMYVTWDDCEFGAPAIDSKRPYGNSYVERDMAEILVDGFADRDYADQETWIEVHRQEMIRLHAETGLALQICVRVGRFETGLYRREWAYSSNWEKVDDGAAPVTIDGQVLAEVVEHFFNKLGFAAPETVPSRLEDFRRLLLTMATGQVPGEAE